MFVDANVLIDIFERDEVWYEWSLAKLQECSANNDLIINHIVYAELASAFVTLEELDNRIESLGLEIIDLSRQAAFLAGKAFAEYRKNGGTKTNVLSDFFIGAHAQVMGVPILTRDVQRYRTYFPDVTLVTPTVQ